MRPFKKRHRRTNYTILLVGEGKADCCFLEIIRRLYLPRSCGVSLTIRDGRGFGGQRTLERAIELKRDTPYDACGVLVDTDRHWSDAERTLARASNIRAFENNPCLEALILRIMNEREHPTSHANKRAFERKFGGEAHQDGVLERYLNREVMDTARTSISVVDELLIYLRVPR